MLGVPIDMRTQSNFFFFFRLKHSYKMNEDKINPYLKYFVRETQSESKQECPSLDNNSSQAYNDVIATTASRKAKYRQKHRLRQQKLSNLSKNVKRINHSISNSDEQNVNVLFKAITHDSVESIEQILHDNKFDVNSRDAYQWTPLMCACHRGDVAIVRLLLGAGAKVNVRDTAGNGPLSIAKQCNHQDVYKLIENRLDEICNIDTGQPCEDIPSISHVVDEIRDEKETVSPIKETKEKNQQSVDIDANDLREPSSDLNREDGSTKLSQTVTNTNESVPCICISSSDSDGEQSMTYCDLCNMNVKETSHREHLLSTVHQFYKQMKANESGENKVTKPVHYGIPEESRGFQMLLKSGWTKQKGLGKREAGIRAPIKTKTKLDRKGMGKRKETVRIHSVLPELNVKFNPALRKHIEKKKEQVFRSELNGS